MYMLFVYILVYILQLIKIALESMSEISRCCFSNEAIKPVVKGSSSSNLLSNILSRYFVKRRTQFPKTLHLMS